MRLICSLLATSVLFFSCALKSLKPDAETMKAMEDVVNTYGGQLSYAFGVKTSTSTGTSKYVTLTLEGTQFLSKVAPDLLTTASAGMAYTFFKPLSKNLKFTDLNIVIKEGDRENEYAYPVAVLKKIDSVLPKFNRVIKLYETGNFEKLVDGIFPPDSLELSKNLVNNLKKQEEKWGAITKQSLFFGFADKSENGKEFILVCYRIFREKESNWINLVLDFSSKEPQLVGIQSVQ